MFLPPGGAAVCFFCNAACVTLLQGTRGSSRRHFYFGGTTWRIANRQCSGARHSPKTRIQPDHKVLITDGPYLETKEHVGGFWILEVADMHEAFAWARKAVVACLLVIPRR